MTDLEFWVDGSCGRRNPVATSPRRPPRLEKADEGQMGAGIVGYSDAALVGWSVPLGAGTSARAELLAVQEALLRVRDRWSSRVTVYSDSIYAVRAFSGRMKPKANLWVIEDAQQLIADCASFRICKCDGHAGVFLNEEADRLAKLARTTQKRSFEEIGER